MLISVCVCPQSNPRAAGIVAGLLDTEADLQVMPCDCRGDGPRCAAAPPTADIVVIPAGVPDMKDLDHLQAVLQLHPGAPVIVLGLYEDTHFTRRLHDMGAAAFLSLDEVIHTLPRVIRRLAAGRETLPQAM